MSCGAVFPKFIGLHQLHAYLYTHASKTKFFLVTCHRNAQPHHYHITHCLGDRAYLKTRGAPNRTTDLPSSVKRRNHWVGRRIVPEARAGMRARAPAQPRPTLDKRWCVFLLMSSGILRVPTTTSAVAKPLCDCITIHMPFQVDKCHL